MKTHILTTIVIFALAGCSRAASSSDAPAEAKIDSMGVFAETDKGLVKLETAGLRDGQDSYGFSGSLDFVSVGRVTAVYINIPQFALSDETTLFWSTTEAFNKYTRGVQSPHFFERHAEALRTTITKRTDGVYKISVSAADAARAGVVVMKVPLPRGSTDRVYPIAVSPK